MSIDLDVFNDKDERAVKLTGVAATRAQETESDVLKAIAVDLREYMKLKYAGDCKCGHCQLVPDDLLNRAAYWMEVMAWYVEKFPMPPLDNPAD